MEAVALGAAVCRGRAGLELLQGVNLVQRLCLAALFLQERKKQDKRQTGQYALELKVNCTKGCKTTSSTWLCRRSTQTDRTEGLNTQEGGSGTLPFRDGCTQFVMLLAT